VHYAAEHSEGAKPNMARSAFNIIGNFVEISYYIKKAFAPI